MLSALPGTTVDEVSQWESGLNLGNSRADGGGPVFGYHSLKNGLERIADINAISILQTSLPCSFTIEGTIETKRIDSYVNCYNTGYMLHE